MPRAKRTVLSGFPKDVYFLNREELDAYFEGDRIDCLLCGHSFRQLEPHLTAVHSISCDDYREKFGIPYTRGLCCSSKSEAAKTHMETYFAENPEEKQRRKEQVDENRHLATSNGQRGKPKFWRLERTKYPVEMWFEVGQRVASGETLSQACRSVGIPHQALLSFALRTYPNFRAFWRREVQPFRKIGIGENLKAENPNRPYNPTT